MIDSLPTTCLDGKPCKRSREVDELHEVVERLSQLVHSDPLTQLFNYRHFSQILAQELERSQRTLQATSLIMLDVDHFKKVNDQWGHEQGNRALKLIAKGIVNNIRKLDIACRYGGEEFAIILPSSDIVTSARVAERVRASIENTPLKITLDTGEQINVALTASAGLSTYHGNKDPNTSKVVEAADEQLYLAKQQGRNRICFAQPDTENYQQVSHQEKQALATLFND
ncbi:MAG: diguanylate cyclase (GGDEF)-like protein [Candidatus Endobugula sp.]|jgi:diguanylate cyclase (GGDEF)-like protein